MARGRVVQVAGFCAGRAAQSGFPQSVPSQSLTWRSRWPHVIVRLWGVSKRSIIIDSPIWSARSVAGVLRGLHYQDESAPMGKLVRCTGGSIFDVAVDLRVGSPTFGKWFGVELSADNMRQVMIPSGFAHGFVTLSDRAEVQYKCTGFYNPASEGTIAWNDRDVAIQWPISEPVLSARDQKGMTLDEYLRKPAFKFSTGGK